MPILAGFHAEGNDYLILHALLAKLLPMREEDILIDFIDSPGRGWQFVLEFIPKALHRFYGRCAQVAIVGIDNDGGVDLERVGVPEDPSHPRHENHQGTTSLLCRYCRIEEIVSRTRPQLNWIPKKPGNTWPILISVPVEMIETWLLILQGNPNAQLKPRAGQKQLLYGRPVATRDDVLSIAIPLVRSMTQADCENLLRISASFRDLHGQLEVARSLIFGDQECW